MKVFIKNMSCPVCRKSLESEMKKIGIPFSSIETNEVEIEDNISKDQLIMLQRALIPYGLVLLLDKKSVLVEKIKIVIATLINNSSDRLIMDLGKYLKTKIKKNYEYLNHIFSEETGHTIDIYFISQKVKKLSEIRRINDLNKHESFIRMQYSSHAHLA